MCPKSRWHEQIRLDWERQHAGVLACRVVVRRERDVLEGGKGKRGMALEWQAEEPELAPAGNGGGPWSLCAVWKKG